MPHAHHFLERLDRVDREQTEFALSLYNDHEAVKFVLEHASLPEVAPRVALALDGDPRGPVVVVTRDGRFVTCLGAGMRHDDLPILERPRLEALLAKAADKRARREMVARELRPDEEEGNIFQRVLTRGSRFAREDFMVLSAFEPLLGLAPFVLLLDIGVDAMKTRASMSVGAMNATVNGATRKALEKLDRLEWATAHLTMLAGAAERKTLDKFLNLENTARTTTTFPCTAQGGSTFYLRAAWMVGRFGKAVIPAYKATFERAKDWMNMLDAGLGLAAIALRSSGSAGDVRRILEGYGPAVTTKPATPEESRRNVAAAMLAAIADPEPRIESTLKAGQYLAVSLSAHLPDGHPHRYKTEADVPDDVARTTALCFDATIMNPTMQQYVITAIPVAARAAAEDFYQPRELIKAWYGPWKPEETLVRLQGWIAACAKSEPTRVERTPGRNEPCSCGSGKKWKKCHGAPQSPA